MRVEICIPSHDDWKGGFGVSLATLCAGGMTSAGVDDFGIINRRGGSLLPWGRHLCAEAALARGADWLLWLDSDMRFPPDTLARLLAHGKPIVGTASPTRVPPIRRATMMRQHPTKVGGYEVTDLPASGCHPVGALGFGVILVHRTVFEAIELPWFHLEWMPEYAKFKGEDVYFCEKARAAGFELWMDADLSHQVGHIGTFIYTTSENADIATIRSQARTSTEAAR